MKRLHTRGFLVALTLAFAGSLAGAEPARDLKIDAATRAKVIDSTLAVLAKSYVFPDLATKIEAEMRKYQVAKKYDSITSGRVFAETLTQDLQALGNDRHLRVFFDAGPIPDRKPDDKPTPAEAERHREQIRFWNAEIVTVERLRGNVGYLRIDRFVEVEDAAPRYAAAMTLLADTGALIIDLRYNGGGHAPTVALLISYLFAADDERHISDIYWRPDNSTRQYWTMPDLGGTRYPTRPVYILTSKNTFSAAEELAYDAQNLERATIVGEVTRGGANPSEGLQKIHEHFAVNVPSGRAINPVTKTNWEGVGVKPDVLAVADKALDVAYLAALRHVRSTIDAKRRPGMADEIDGAITKLKPPSAKP